MTELSIGLANYSAQNWAMLKKIADDPERLDDSYQDWLDGRDKAIRNFEELGQRVQLIDIDVTELLNWCRVEGRKLDGEARAEFCSKKQHEIWGQ